MVTRKKSNSKSKAKPCHMVFAITTESISDDDSLFDIDNMETPFISVRSSSVAKTSLLNAKGGPSIRSPLSTEGGGFHFKGKTSHSALLQGGT